MELILLVFMTLGEVFPFSAIAQEVADEVVPVGPTTVRWYWWSGGTYLALGIGGIFSIWWFMPIRSSLVVCGGSILSFLLVLAGGCTLEVAANLRRRLSARKQAKIPADEWPSVP